MDQKEMMERLKRDPAALQAVMGSRDGQMLLGLLSGSDGGRTLQQAVRQADVKILHRSRGKTRSSK